MSSKFLHLNRNKRSLVLDLKQDAGREALLKLIARGDVFLWNVRPSAMARLKLSYDEVRAVNPGSSTVECSDSAAAAATAKTAYDTIIQGGAGVAALHHRVLGEPRYIPSSWRTAPPAPSRCK